MSPKGWEDTIDTALSLGAEHISAYHLTYEQGTVFYKKLEKGVFSETPEEESLQQFSTLIGKLKKAGYEHYEVSNFSLPGKKSLHNSNYWNGVKYFGFGPSAHSFDGKKRWWNVSDIKRYLKEDFIESEEILTDTDRYNELVMLKLRTSEGVSEEELKDRGERFYVLFLSNIRKHISGGDVKYENGRFFITEKGIFISDHIISDLFF
jgi:oxygen-independent coproporphyrinogen-3 oxidase